MNKNDQRVGHVPMIAENLFLRPCTAVKRKYSSRDNVYVYGCDRVHCPYLRGWSLMYWYSNVFEPKRFTVYIYIYIILYIKKNIYIYIYIYIR